MGYLIVSLFFISSLIFSFSTTSVSAVTCGTSQYDLSSIYNQTITAYVDGYPWAVSPCGQVTYTLGLQCTGQVCQGDILASTYDSTTVWTPTDNGVIAFSQNGAVCSTNRAVSLWYVCNVTATTPFISDATEDPECYYMIYIQTSAACGVTVSSSVGTTFISDHCGGKAYYLDNIGNEISFPVLDTSANQMTQVFISPCNSVQNQTCSALGRTSVCQAYYPLTSGDSNAYNIADYDPAQAPATYTILTNGIQQTYIDGAYANNYPRKISISYLCSSSATTAYADPTSWTVTTLASGQLLYSVNVYTNVVCSTPFTTTPQCGTSTYNLAALWDTSYSFNTNGYTYWVAPCGNVQASTTAGCTGQVCQSDTLASYYTPSSVTWTPASNGVVQSSSNGDLCYSNNVNYGYRSSNIRFVCNSTATTAFISSALELPMCHYTIEIQTSIVCGISVSTATGSSYYSDNCGGNLYNLNAMSPGVDITYTTGSNSLVFNPCGVSWTSSCGNGTNAVCLNGQAIAEWSPFASPILYTVNSNGITQTFVSSSFCGIIPQQVIITYTCDSTATTPIVSSFSGPNSNCQYNIAVSTSKVCTPNNFLECGPTTYGLSQSLADVQLSATISGTSWVVNPCSAVAGISGCATGQVCQAGSYIPSYYDGTQVWTPADNGIIQTTHNGQSCGGDGDRMTHLRFVCNPTASSPYISDAAEEPTCHYVVYIQTAAVCNVAVSHSVGSSYYSDLCGGGAYDLNLLGGDIQFQDSNSNTYYFSACNVVVNSACNSIVPDSFCQVTSSGTVNQLAIYDPARFPILYTINSNGITQSYANGMYSSGNPVGITVNYVCSQSATTPSVDTSTFTSSSSTGQLIYTFTVNTNVVCNTPFQTPSCSYGSYDFSSFYGLQLQYQTGGYTYYVSPCGNVDSPDNSGCSGMVCQGGTEVTRYDPTMATWTQADNGVILQIQNGYGCSGPRQSTLWFICDLSAATPTIESIVEDPQCFYTIQIHTNLACGQALNTAASWVSTTCGGGAYPLTLVGTTSDLTYAVTGTGNVYLNPCGTIRTSSVCSGTSSVSACLHSSSSSGSDTVLATYNTQGGAPIFYALTSNGLTQTHHDGTYCGTAPQTTTITYVCSTSAATPSITGYNAGTCTTSIEVTTSAVCGTAFTHSCSFLGTDFTSLFGGKTFGYYDGSYYWSVAPCGVVNDVFFPSCLGQICQSGYAAAYYNLAAATTIVADNGFVALQQNGDSCGGDGLRETAMRFVCDPTASVPFVSNAFENPTCHYIVYIRTAAACGFTVSHTVGSTWVSDQCGGGAYPLYDIFNDLSFPASGPSYVFINPCNTVQNLSCSNLGSTSVCQAYTPLSSTNPTNDYQLAIYSPWSSVFEYTLTTVNGANAIIQYYANGWYNNGYPRSMQITYICSPTATTAYADPSSWVGLQETDGQDAYSINIYTSIVCGQPFAKPPCVYGGYNLTSLEGLNLQINTGGYVYTVSPCGQVTLPSTIGCLGQVCQGTTSLSLYSPAATTYYQADNGLVALTVDGTYCAGIDGDRQTMIRYVCSSSATTPIITAVDEEPECHYTVYISTNLVCNVALNESIGASFVSDSCGGGAYSLSKIDYIISGTVDNGEGVVFINPCGVVNNAYCSSLNAAVCYAYTPLGTTNNYDLARYVPTQAPITYTILSNGLLQSHQDGDYCGSGTNNPRIVNIYYLCDSSAHTASISSFTTSSTDTSCVYTINVATSVTCGPAFHHSSSGLSGGAIAGIVIGVIFGVLLLLLILYCLIFVVGIGEVTKRVKSSVQRDQKFSEMESSKQVGEHESEPSEVEMPSHNQEGEAHEVDEETA